MPFPTGRCGWCDTRLDGQPTRKFGEPRLTAETVASLLRDDGGDSDKHLSDAA
jgi:hypothetical protein